MNIEGFRKRIEFLRSRVDTVAEVVEWKVSEHSDVIVDLNRDQMLLGRNTDGEPFTPSYTDDPYFETPAEARAYKLMKERLTIQHRARMTFVLDYPDKDPDTPNLIVTGPFQDHMFIRTTPDSYTIGSAYKDSAAISAKYDNKVFGLTDVSRKYFYDHYLYHAIRKHIGLE